MVSQVVHRPFYNKEFPTNVYFRIFQTHLQSQLQQQQQHRRRRQVRRFRSNASITTATRDRWPKYKTPKEAWLLPTRWTTQNRFQLTQNRFPATQNRFPVTQSQTKRRWRLFPEKASTWLKTTDRQFLGKEFLQVRTINLNICHFKTLYDF